MRTSLLLFGIIFLLWTIYRYFFHFSDAVDELVAKPIIFLLPILIVLSKEKIKIQSLGLTTKHLSRNSLIGIGLGLFLVLEVILTLWFKNGSILFNPDNLIPIMFVGAFVISFATGFIEEIVFRGYFQTTITKVYNNVVAGILISTLFFIALHLPRAVLSLHYGFSQISSWGVQLFILSVLNGLAFRQTKSLTAPIIMHTLWNFSVVIIK